MNPHRTHRPDGNRNEIVAAFERLGWTVFNTGMVGEGFPDMVVAYNSPNINYEPRYYVKALVEIKNGNAGYTTKEKSFMEKYPGLVTTVRSVEDVERMFG